jgi:hypothetical protein
VADVPGSGSRWRVLLTNMPSSSEFREYENGIADVLASVVGEAGTVQ